MAEALQIEVIVLLGVIITVKMMEVQMRQWLMVVMMLTSDNDDDDADADYDDYDDYDYDDYDDDDGSDVRFKNSFCS
jgi:hypothetical protein